MTTARSSFSVSGDDDKILEESADPSVGWQLMTTKMIQFITNRLVLNI
jgi:hypothetical protein